MQRSLLMISCIARHTPTHLAPTRSRVGRLAGIMLGFALWACTGREATVPVAGLARVVHFPNDNILAFDAGPYGLILFAADQVHMRTVDDLSTGVRLELPGQYLTHLTAISRSEFYAAGRECNALFHWRAGSWVPLDTMVARVFASRGGQICIQFTGLVSSGTDDVTAVGSPAAVVRWNGARWSAEANPLEALRDSAGQRTRAIIWDVGGAGKQRFATGTLDLLADTGAGWNIVARPKNVLPTNCVFRTVAVGTHGALLGGGHPACLARYNAGQWENLSGFVKGFRDYLFDSNQATAAVTVTWNYFGDVAVVHGDRVRGLRLPISNLIGVAYVGGSLVVAGNNGDHGVVGTVTNEDWEK